MHHGAKIVSGGKTIGNCYVPTILESDCMNDIANCKEVFGPVVTISKVKNLDQAIVCCNKSPFGLHSAIFTNNINNAYKAINELDCSGVMVNDSTDYRIDAMPFGGVKSSGVGREGVKSAIEAMSETKVVCLKLKIWIQFIFLFSSYGQKKLFELTFHVYSFSKYIGNNGLCEKS